MNYYENWMLQAMGGQNKFKNKKVLVASYVPTNTSIHPAYNQTHLYKVCVYGFL